jgi:hypothetical protein
MSSLKIRKTIASLAALAFPGLGHLFLKKWGRSVLLASSILVLFIWGLMLEGKLFEWDLSQPILLLPFLANLGIGAPYWCAKALGYGIGDIQNQSYDYGTTFLIVAGLLNMLVVLNAYDIASGRRK